MLRSPAQLTWAVTRKASLLRSLIHAATIHNRFVVVARAEHW